MESKFIRIRILTASCEALNHGKGNLSDQIYLCHFSSHTMRADLPHTGQPDTNHCFTGINQSHLLLLLRDTDASDQWQIKVVLMVSQDSQMM